MAKSTKKKILSFLNLLILFALFCCLSGCGNKEDVITPTTGTGAQIASFAGSPTFLLEAGNSSILTAQVTDSSGTAVRDKIVTFKIVTNNTGGTLKSVDSETGTTVTGKTDANGKATAIYTAGSNLSTSSIDDTLSATCGATELLVITRSSSSVETYNISLKSPSAGALNAGQSTIITATVTDKLGVPVSGQEVTFSFYLNESGATLKTVGTGITDGSGIATAIYTAGAAMPDIQVYDDIKASITAGYGSSEYFSMTRLTSTATATGLYMGLTADTYFLNAGQSTIITATVKDSSGTVALGKNVTFGFVTNNSGASLSAVNGTTDASGRATAVYTAGAGSSGNVQDIVKASVTDGTYSTTEAAIITRKTSSTGGSTGVRLTVEAKPTSLVAGAMSVIVAQVNKADGTAAPGLAVTFGFVTNNSGAPALIVVNGTTDASGTATAIYTAGNKSPSLSIQDVVSATVTGSTGAVIITRSKGGGTGSSLSMSLTPTPRTVYAGQQSIVIATVLNVDAKPATGQTVTFSFAGGATNGTSGAYISTINSGLTNSSGEAWAVYTGGSLNGSYDLIDIVQASVSGTVALTTITRSKADYTSGGYSIISFGGIPATGPGTGKRFSDTGAANCQLKATVASTDILNPGVAGIPVTFAIFRGPGTLPTVTTILTDTNGEAWIFFDLPVPGAGTETIVRATVPLVPPQTKGGDAVSVIYW